MTRNPRSLHIKYRAISVFNARTGAYVGRLIAEQTAEVHMAGDTAIKVIAAMHVTSIKYSPFPLETHRGERIAVKSHG